MNAVFRLLIGLGLLVAQGCYTDPGETTGIGAAAGGVLGAGLGAIVGAQTGDPGAGLVLGGVAGTAAGAAIGNQIESDEEEHDQRRERIARTEQRLASQRSEIESLRSMQDSSGDLRGRVRVPITDGFNRAPMRSEPRKSVTAYGPGPQWTAPRGSDYPVGSAARITSSTKIESRRGERDLLPSQPEEVPYPVENRSEDNSNRPSNIFAPTNSEKLEALPEEKDAGADSKVEIDSDVAKLSLDSHDLSLANNAKPVAKKDGVTAIKNIKASEGAKAAVAAPLSDAAVEPANSGFAAAAVVETSQKSENTGGGQCGTADQEYRKGQSATESADRLFHIRRAIRLCPSSPKYHNELGKLYQSMKRSKDAEYEFRQALNIDPNFEEASANIKTISAGETN